MNGIRLSHGAVFVSDGLCTVRLLPTGECGPSPVLLPTLEWELRTEPPGTWDYMTEAEIRALPDGGFEKISAAMDKMRSVLESEKSYGKMLFLSEADFFERAAKHKRLAREEEAAFARLMKEGDAEAKNKIICSYLPTVAAFVRKVQKGRYSLELIYRLIDALEKEIDRFDFSQKSEVFAHRLALVMRRTLTEYIADK